MKGFLQRNWISILPVVLFNIALSIGEAYFKEKERAVMRSEIEEEVRKEISNENKETM